MDINGFQFATVVSIVAICYLVGMIINKTKYADTWTQIGCMVAGGVLGIVGLYTIPDFPASDVLNAIAIGIANGLAASGVYELKKNLTK